MKPRSPVPIAWLVALHACTNPLQAATITFIGGNTTWTDNVNNADFNPADEPDTDDDLVFNTPNTVILGSINSVLTLTMSNGISLNTKGFDLTVNGLISLAGTGTELVINGTGSSVDADSVTINSGSEITLDGGALFVVEETGTGFLDLNSGGRIRGQGTISLADSAIGSPTSLMANDGAIQASAPGLFVGTPPAGSLFITAADPANARIDLDGTSGNGQVIVSRNQTLDINPTLTDAFSGNIELFHDSALDIANSWTMDNGTIVADNGFVDNGNINFNIPASTSFIAGGIFTQTGGTITVADADGALQFDALFQTSGGSLVNNGEVIFNADATIGATANLTMPTTSSSITLGAGAVVNVDQPNFNADGAGSTNNVITIGSGANLDLDLGSGADESITGTLSLNGGEIDVTTASGSWMINGSVNLGAGTGISQINGQTLTFTNVPVTVGNGSVLDVNAAHTWGSGSSLNIGSGATAELGNATFDSPGSISGTGVLRCIFNSAVTGNTTIAVNQFDWDGTATVSTHTIHPGAVLTVNSPVFDGDGDMDDAFVLGGNGGALTVNGPTSWKMLNTLTANNANVGVATIGGTSRMVLESAAGILNANGDTTISAPVTFGQSSTIIVAENATLQVDGNTIYDGCVITGDGNFNPTSAGNNQVVGSTIISTENFNFDRGPWTVEANANLNVNVADYEPDSATDAFDSAITINSGSANVTSAAGAFVMDENLNLNNTNGKIPTWSGDPLSIGNGTGTLDADLNVSGKGPSQIIPDIEFKSDADVNVVAGSTLEIHGEATFNSGGTAEFTGAGRIEFRDDITFFEETTIDMPGGSLDFDADDAYRGFVAIQKPVTIRAATFEDFGDRLSINSSGTTGLGTLAVNLDNPEQEWTISPAGSLTMTLRAGSNGNLLIGADVNIEGSFNIVEGSASGDSFSGAIGARTDISGTVSINGTVTTLSLNGGGSQNPNTLAGGTIGGFGFLSGTTLSGFGTVDSKLGRVGLFGNILQGTLRLLADNGILTINSSMINTAVIGTADTDGILFIPRNWNASDIGTLLLQGGEVRGGTITNEASNGIRGHGLLSARVDNIGQIIAEGDAAPLIVQNTTNLNDWDGSGNSGTLGATDGILECRDNLDFPFFGTVSCSEGTVRTSGFGLEFEPGSFIDLNGGTYSSSGDTRIGGDVFVGSGSESAIAVDSGKSLTFEAGSSTTLFGDLRLSSPLSNIRFGAVFNGPGLLIVPESGLLRASTGVDLDVILEVHGRFAPGDSTGTTVGRIDLGDYVQSTTGRLEIGIAGTALNQFDRLVVSGEAQLDGMLEIDRGDFPMALGKTFTIISAPGGVTGTFDGLLHVGTPMPPGLKLDVVYGPTFVQLKVVVSDPFEDWINSFSALTDPAAKTRAANPDGDQLNNLGEFALDGDPGNGGTDGKIVGKIASVAGAPVMTLTFPVRTGSVPAPDDPAGGELVLVQAADQLTYRIQATDDLSDFTRNVSEITGPDAAAIQTGLPALNSGWGYRSFRGPGPISVATSRFLRVSIDE